MYEKGLQNRRDVLGADYVDGSIASATEFNKPLQDLVTEFCWGSVWGREGLTRKQRSMLNLECWSLSAGHTSCACTFAEH